MVLGAFAGFVLMLVVGGFVGGFFAYLFVKKTEADARKGWNLVPVVVAAQDLQAGDTVEFEQISQRSVPEQLVSSSIVKPDSASYIVHQQLNAPVFAGEPLRWSGFVVHELPDGGSCRLEELEACQKLAPEIREKTLEELRTRLGVKQ
jgi:Flp pilus assembly protein CpaB